MIANTAVDDINRNTNYGNYGIFPVMGNAGLISSTLNPKP